VHTRFHFSKSTFVSSSTRVEKKTRHSLRNAAAENNNNIRRDGGGQLRVGADSKVGAALGPTQPFQGSQRAKWVQQRHHRPLVPLGTSGGAPAAPKFNMVGSEGAKHNAGKSHLLATAQKQDSKAHW